MYNMTDMNPLLYICIICTPHFADGPCGRRAAPGPGPLSLKLVTLADMPYQWSLDSGSEPRQSGVQPGEEKSTRPRPAAIAFREIGGVIQTFSLFWLLSSVTSVLHHTSHHCNR